MFQRGPVSCTAIYDLLQLCGNNEEAIHLDFVLDKFRLRAHGFQLAQGIEPIGVSGQTGVVQAVWIKKTNTDRLVAAVAPPEDEVRVKAAVVEESDAYLRQIAEQIDLEAAVAFFMLMGRPKRAQVLHKVPLIFTKARGADGDILQPKICRVQQQCVEKAVVYMQSGQRRLSISIKAMLFYQTFDLCQDFGWSTHPVGRCRAFLHDQRLRFELGAFGLG